MGDNINDKLDKLIAINEKLIEEKKVKKWKLPMSGKLSKKQKKQGYVTYILIRNSGHMDFTKAPIDESTTLIEGIPRIATPDDILRDAKGNPFIIQPEWSVKPFSRIDAYSEDIKNQTLAAGFKLLLNTMKKDALELKKKSSGGSWIIWIVVAVAAIAGIAYISGVKLW